MKKSIFVLCLLFAFGQFIFGQSNQRIIGYVMGPRIQSLEEEINVRRLTHINYAFADVVDGKVVELNTRDSANFVYLNALKPQNPDLKLLISVGGWTKSGGFSDAVLTPESREIFAQSAIDYMTRHRLDGIDLDWEYPGQAGIGNTFRAEDKENFTAALKLLREKLDMLGEDNDTHYLLTIASAASQKYLDHVEMEKIQAYLDFINIMTYDYFGAWSTETGNHAQLYPNGDQAVQQHIKAGAPPEKLCLGVAFYGRGWKNVDGMRMSASKEAVSARYKNIKDSILSGYEERWDSTAQAPYIWDADTRTVIGYDSPASMRLKVNYVKAHNLGGIMFWEYSGDADNELLKTIYDEFHTIPGHAHNDYENKNPLMEALNLGFRSIEVDVHLIEDELYVAHNRPLDLSKNKTLENLYLKPLSESQFSQFPLLLLIDIKSNAEKTHHKLKSTLEKYPIDSVKYVISGNRAIELILSDSKQLMSIDGRPDDLDKNIPTAYMPLISQNYNRFFSSRDPSKIDTQEIKAFQEILQLAHQQGKLVRLWASPDDDEVWRFLMKLGVDLINTDSLEAFHQFYKVQKKSSAK